MIGGPIIWLFVTPRFDSQGPNSVLYGLGTAMVLALAGYAISSHVIRLWRR